MPEPFRLRVMKAVTEQLKTIPDLADFTDAVGRTQERVFRGRTIFGDNDPLPMVSVLEDPRLPAPMVEGSGSAASANAFRILIQGFVRDDPFHPLDPAYQLSAEVTQALVRAKSTRFNVLGLGSKAPCVMSISIAQPVHRPADDEVSSVAYFLIAVTLTLAENLETPFA